MGLPDQEWAEIVGSSGRRAWTLTVKPDGRALAKYRPLCKCGGYKPEWAKTITVRDAALPVENPAFQEAENVNDSSHDLITPYLPTHWRKGNEVADDVSCFFNPLYVSNKFDGIQQHEDELELGVVMSASCITVDWDSFLHDEMMKPATPTARARGHRMPREGLPARLVPMLEYPLNWRPYVEGALSECQCGARKHQRPKSCATAAATAPKEGGKRGCTEPARLVGVKEEVWHESEEWDDWLGQEWLGVANTMDGGFNVNVNLVVDGAVCDLDSAFEKSARQKHARRCSNTSTDIIRRVAPRVRRRSDRPNGGRMAGPQSFKPSAKTTHASDGGFCLTDAFDRAELLAPSPG